VLAPYFCALAAVVASHASAQDPPKAAPAPSVPLAARVNRAIADGVKQLRSAQSADGKWGGAEDAHPGGMTALCTLTLLKSGVRRGDDAIQRALRSVYATEFKSTYAHSVRLLMLDALGLPDVAREKGAASLDFLVANQREGVWAYPTGGIDLSNTQFVMLGLRAAHRVGLEVPAMTVFNAIKALPHWLDRDTGGFAYSQDRPASGGITAATLGGIAVLDELAKGNGQSEGLLRKFEPERKRAAAWFADRFDAGKNPWGAREWTPGFQYAYLWAVERYGGLTKQDKLGAHDWYTEGAEWLVAQQLDDGSWGKTEDTCFALLFLRRATVTVDDEPAASDDALAPRARETFAAPAADVPRIVDWLAAGPWIDRDSATLLDKPPFDPAKERPRDGANVAKKFWRRVALKADGWTNLDEALASECEPGIVALATVLECRPDQHVGAVLWLDLEDGFDVFFDGGRVARDHRVQGPIDNSVRIELDLAPGKHTLLVVVQDAFGAAAFGARLCALDGKRLPDPPSVALGAPPKAGKR
jgi:hypothetical protein